MVVNSTQSVAERYREFSEQQARGTSPVYAELTARISEDQDLCALIAALPPGNKQQPNLLLAAVRFLGGPYDRWAPFRAWTLAHWDDVREVILARFTQTNEPARCAPLLPLLAGLPQPLALIEVGASAGLCLHPDRYAYRYNGGATLGTSPVTFDCRTEGPAPLPTALPDIAWRAGIDLNPLDTTDEDDVRWLQSLIWPSQVDRPRQQLAAIEAVRTAPRPRIVRGDLVDELPALAAEAPADATLVVFHTAVLMYLPLARREEFAALVRALPGHWISNEHHTVLPWLDAPAPDDEHLLTLAIDERAVAFTAPHGQSLHWFDRPAGGRGPA
ncbi:DUF2332 domain-containing protein [Streptomyces sp. ISL-100]|uniref:DUF2332 domain-containing protein n=1 Tax=Streptomyces sp. ISL-100 TaxID=2819173 RepID=UPI001BEBB4D3|nr:DUF2332 domain-containing protein [Streptomyces sp. ISL-100]MBT2400779.1 DUF2332 domain-containing protein [Streptomyces sp. ISL-100]